MKRFELVVLITAASLMVVGCGGGGGNGVGPVEPDPNTTGTYGLEFTVLWTDGTPADGVKLQVTGDTGTRTVPVSDGVATISPLDRNVGYQFSFINEDGELIELNFGGEEVGTSFSLFLAEGEHLDKLNIPVFTLMPKVIPPTTGTMVIITNPPGATVWVDGEEQPTLTPVEFTKVPPGLRQVKVLLEGYEEQTFTVDVFAGEASERNLALVKKALPIDSFPTEPTAWIVFGIFSPPEKYYFWRTDHKIYHGSGENPLEVGTITDDGAVEIRVWRRIFEGQFYPDDMKIRGEATAPEDPSYHATFIFERVE